MRRMTDLIKILSVDWDLSSHFERQQTQFVFSLTIRLFHFLVLVSFRNLSLTHTHTKLYILWAIEVFVFLDYDYDWANASSFVDSITGKSAHTHIISIDWVGFCIYQCIVLLFAKRIGSPAHVQISRWLFSIDISQNVLFILFCAEKHWFCVYAFAKELQIDVCLA